MRLIHTSDWHLGQSLHGHERYAEHEAFLGWLLDELQRRQPDALLIAGDIFDLANPSAQAQRLYYGFLGQALARLPDLDIVVIAGNHDSPARIDAPRSLLQALRVQVVGQYHGDESQRVSVPIRRSDGSIGAWVLAVPFLRPADLTPIDAQTYAEGIARVYREVVNAALAQRQPEQALIAMGHLHVQGGKLSEHSERRLVIGGEEAVPNSIFPSELAYVALGHLHLAQEAGAPWICYSGSPLPMSFSEIDYPHQIIEIEIEGPRLVALNSTLVPRPALIRRIPERHLPLSEVLELLAALDFPPSAPGLQPLIEVQIERAWGDPDPMPLVRAALEGKGVRLAAVKAIRPAAPQGGAAPTLLSIDQLMPLPLFERLVRERTCAAPDETLLQAFGELFATAHAQD